MSRYIVDVDERYPDFSVSPYEERYSARVIELSDDEFADYSRVVAEYNAWADRLENLSTWKPSARKRSSLGN